MLPRNAAGNNDVVHEVLSPDPDALGGLVRNGFPGRHEVVNPDAVEQEAMVGDQSPVAFCGLDAFVNRSAGKASAEDQVGHSEDSAAGQRAHHCAVDPDELQVLAHLQFDLA